MRPVYAAQFEVLPPPDFSQDTLPGLVRTEAGDWVSQWYAEHQGLSVSLPFDGGSIEPLSGHRVSVTAATPELGHDCGNCSGRGPPRRMTVFSGRLTVWWPMLAAERRPRLSSTWSQRSFASALLSLKSGAPA